MDINCGCPGGTFPYELTRGDIKDNDVQTELHIAHKFGLISDEVFDSLKYTRVSEGDYTSVVGKEHLITTGEYGAAHKPQTEEFLFHNQGFVVDLKRDILALACQSRYPDSSGQIAALTGISYNQSPGSTVCDDTSGGGLLQMPDEFATERATTDEVAALMELRDSILYWAREHGLASMMAAFEGELDDNALLQYYNAVHNDEKKRHDLLKKLDALRPVLDTWSTVKDREAHLLAELDEKIAIMGALNVLADISVGDIIDTFDRFYVNLKDRFDLLATLDEIVDYDRLDLVRLTPDERKEWARQDHILKNLERAQVDVQFGHLPKDPERFNQLVREAIQQGLFYQGPDGENAYASLQAQGYLESHELERWQASYGMDYESQVPYGSYAAADIAFERMDTFGTDVDPLEVYAFEEIAEDVFFVAGFIPIVGTFIDIADAVISLAEGDYADAALSAIFAVIDINDLFRLADRMGGLADHAGYTLRQLPDDAAEFRQARQHQIDAVFSKNEQFRAATKRLDDQWRASGMAATPSRQRVLNAKIKALVADESDIPQVLDTLRQLEVDALFDELDREDVELLKHYMFLTPFTDSWDKIKYDAWRFSAEGRPSYYDTGILVHELEEAKAFVRYRRELEDRGVDVSNWLQTREQMNFAELQRLVPYFSKFYGFHSSIITDVNPGHSQALATEFQYYANLVKHYTGIELSPQQAAVSSLSRTDADNVIQALAIARLSGGRSGVDGTIRGNEAYRAMYIADEAEKYRLLSRLNSEMLNTLRFDGTITVEEDSLLVTRLNFEVGEQIYIHHVINALQKLKRP